MCEFFKMSLVLLSNVNSKALSKYEQHFQDVEKHKTFCQCTTPKIYFEKQLFLFRTFKKILD